MRCSSRSTTWLGSLALAAGFGLLFQPPARAGDGRTAAAPESAVRHAVVQAVKARMGQDADVRIEELDVTTTPPPEGAVLAATPEPGARLGRRSRFSLQWVLAAGLRKPPVAGGYATAKVFVATEHVRATREIDRGETCAAPDVATSRGEVGAVLLQRLPGLTDVAGARALRSIAVDEVVTRISVRSGDVVAVRAAVDGVTVLGQAVAQQSGSEGDVIRVVNRASRRSLKARIVGAGRVEVIQ
jgi:flagella basal body P-ring formation protein FlgA